jgi:hypothetical protein
VLLGTLVTSAVANEPRTVSVSGVAVIEAVPDHVVFRLGVETFGRTLPETTGPDREVGAALVAAIRELGVEERDIATSALDLQPQYKEGTLSSVARTGEPVGFLASREYCVRLRDVSAADRLLEVALGAGVNRIASVSFETSRAVELREEARLKAAAAARAKAQTLADALGATLGPVRSIREEHSGWSTASNSISVVSDESGAANSIAAGQVRVEARLAVVFDLEAP